jgi:hypothetical protein
MLSPGVGKLNLSLGPSTEDNTMGCQRLAIRYFHTPAIFTYCITVYVGQREVVETLRWDGLPSFAAAIEHPPCKP